MDSLLTKRHRYKLQCQLLYLLTVKLPLVIIRRLITSFITKTRVQHLAKSIFKILYSIKLLGYLPDGSKIIYPLSELKLPVITEEIYVRRVYHIDIPQNIRPSLVIDLGSHIGVFTIYAVHVIKADYVLAVEPNPLALHFLLLNILANRLSHKVKVIPWAIYDDEKDVVLHLHLFSLGDASVMCEWHTDDVVDRIVVRAVPLSHLVPYIRKVKPRFLILKIDVEGAEEFILRSMGPLFSMVDTLVLEVHGRNLVEKARKIYELLISRFSLRDVTCLYSDACILKFVRPHITYS